LIGTFEYWWTHGLISDSTYKSLNDSCPESFIHAAACKEVLDIAKSEMGNIDRYSIYTHPCDTTGVIKRNVRAHYVSDQIFLSEPLVCLQQRGYPAHDSWEKKRKKILSCLHAEPVTPYMTFVDMANWSCSGVNLG